ncbi:hypothetical protein ACOSQ3_029006 [Xanthoceras sorbifolium]
MVVNQRGWGKFVQQPIRASLKVVYEFYTVMVPEEFLIGGPVFVKGHEVDISVEAINEYYRLETDVNHVGGLAPNPNLTPYNEDLAKYLRTSGTAIWTSSGDVMKCEELRLDSEF